MECKALSNKLLQFSWYIYMVLKLMKSGFNLECIMNLLAGEILKMLYFVKIKIILNQENLSSPINF